MAFVGEAAQLMSRSDRLVSQIVAHVVFVGIAGGAADRIARRLSQSHPAVSWIPGPPLV